MVCHEAVGLGPRPLSSGGSHDEIALLPYCSRLIGDDAKASEAEHTHLPVEGGAACLTVADTNPQNRSRSGFGEVALALALMKLEPEVIVEPKGTTVNLSLVQPSLEPC
jgi:hypothetical protein